MTANLGAAPDPVIELRRSSLDKLLIAAGVVVAVVLVVAGGLLTWGANFADNYVRDELQSQSIFFSSEEALLAEDPPRTDLVKFAGQQVLTGRQAEAYASYIGGHLPELSYAEQGAGVTAVRNALNEARDSNAPAAEIAELEAEYNRLNAQRDTTFRGETLRGLLLSTYAWSTIGSIAGIAAWVAFGAAAVMVVLVVAGLVHINKHKKTA